MKCVNVALMDKRGPCSSSESVRSLLNFSSPKAMNIAYPAKVKDIIFGNIVSGRSHHPTVVQRPAVGSSKKIAPSK